MTSFQNPISSFLQSAIAKPAFTSKRPMSAQNRTLKDTNLSVNRYDEYDNRKNQSNENAQSKLPKQMSFDNEPEPIRRSESRNSQRKLVSKTQNLQQHIQDLQQNPPSGNPLDDQKTRTIWRTFGSYIAKQLINGKGIIVPGFGVFTFSATEVCLSGTTNPQDRDKQIREPVFMVAREFAANIKTGVYGSQQDTVRPFELKGVNGVIPQVKANFAEISILCNESKDFCKEKCDLVIKHLSGRARRGEPLTVEIPMVGRMMIRGKVAAVSFAESLIQQTRGATAKTFTVGNIFANSNAAHNLGMSVTRHSLGGAIKVNAGAENWLINNLGIDLNQLPAQEYGITPQHHRGLKRSSSMQHIIKKSGVFDDDRESQATPSQQSQTTRSSRPMSAQGSHKTTAMASHMSILPQSDRFTLVTAAQNIFKHRQSISVAALKLKSNLREVLPSSKMLSILRQADVNIDIITIKQLLNELSFPFNGPSTSLTMFLTAIKALLHGQRQFEGRFLRQSDTGSEVSHVTSYVGKNLYPGRIQPEDQKIINTIRDIFYTSQRTLLDLFKIGISGQTVDLDGFIRIIDETSGGAIEPKVSIAIFKLVARQNALTFEKFEKTFRSEVPNSIEMETKVIRTIRDWMYRSNLSAEMAFESFCRVVGNYKQKLLTRAQFHRALITLDVGLSAAQTDSLFALLVNEANGSLDVNMWLSRIFEDGDNPIQMIREIVSEHKLTQEDLLLQMKLKAWDEPLSFTQLTQAIRSLDQSISDIQIRSIFTLLKNAVGLVPVINLISNLTGKEFQTVDFKNKIQKQIYSEIYPEKQNKFLAACQELDKDSNGIIHAKDLSKALRQVVSTVSAEDLERFVKFLEVDNLGKISYLEFIEDLTSSVNKNHNPFRAIINRLAYFLKHNKVTPDELLEKIGQGSGSLYVAKFAEFLKHKVDKKVEIQLLQKLAERTDVDRDGKICATDIATCIKNLSNEAFWRENQKSDSQNKTVSNYNPVEQKLSKDRIIELIYKINQEMGKKKISYRDLFDKFDTNGDNMVSLAEFTQGFTSMINIAAPYAEQLYGIIDKQSIGLINYNQFLDVLKSQKIEIKNFTDNFNWEYSIIDKIKNWVFTQQCTIEEAYKSFDKDFDGLISRKDLVASLRTLLDVPEDQLAEAKIDRLFSLLDTFKAGVVQLSDFQKIVKSASAKNDQFNWKSSVIQQIGQLLQKKFASITESFAAASENTLKINFQAFVVFLQKNRFLNGFNLTNQLLEELFSQIDPHKKGFIALNDWKNTFEGFNMESQKLEELKAVLVSTFVDYESAFNFFLTFGKSNSIIDYLCFQKAVASITSELLKESESANLWKNLSVSGQDLNFYKNEQQIDIYTFRKHFGDLKFKGSQAVTSLKPQRQSKKVSKSMHSKIRTTIITANSSITQMESNIVEKIRGIMKTSARPLQDVFGDFDVDGNGVVTAIEFRNAIRKLNLGLSSKEIDQLMMRIDANSDGMIEYNEFASKFGSTNQQTQMMQERGKEKLAQLKELMTLHMNSVVDAFRYFDSTKDGSLAFSEFNALVQNCFQVAKLKPPTFPVVKDLFDLIDVRKDGQLDITEWQQTFGRVTDGGNQLTIKPSPLSLWETSKEFADICQALAKSRKLLIEKFRSVSTDPKQTLFNFAQGKAALDDWLYQNFQGRVTDTQLKSVFSAAQVPAESQFEPKYDYIRLLDLYKARHMGPQQ